MAFRLIPPSSRSRYFRVRGTECGLYLDRTTQTHVEAEAESLLRRWRDEARSGALVGQIQSGADGALILRIAEALWRADRPRAVHAELPPRDAARYIRMARAALAATGRTRIADEAWLPIPAFPSYQASSLGGIRRVGARGSYSILAQTLTESGHLKVSIYADGRQLTTGVHRLVCLAFKGEPPFKGAVARHLDGVPDHNAPENLAWGSHQDNSDDARQHRVLKLRLV